MIWQAELLTDRKIQGIQQLKGIRLEEIEKNGHISEERKKTHVLNLGGNNIVIMQTCVRWKAEWNGGAMQAFCQLTSVLVTLLTTRLPHYEILCTRSKSNRRPPPP